MKKILMIMILGLLTLTGAMAQNKQTGKKTDKTGKTTEKKGKTVPQDVFKTTAGGMKYLFRENQQGDTAKTGSIITLHFQLYAKTGTRDTLLQSSYTFGEPVSLKVIEPIFKGSVGEGLRLLSPGDSATFLVNADSMFQKEFMQPMPEFVDPGSDLRFEIRALKVQTEDQFKSDRELEMQKQEQEAAQKAEAQKGVEEEKLKKYFADNKINATRSASGLYYVITAPGTGATPKPGDRVAVHYTGTLLEGTKFDSSLDRGEPLSFNAGVQQMIPGFDEGVMLLKEGGKAVLYLPSHLAYGERGAGDAIPPFAVLIFTIELVKVN